MQKLFISGNVGKDAELRRTQGGDPVLGFSLAVDNGKDRDGNRKDSTWYDCSIWGKRAEALETHIRKGTKLALMGRPTAREHNGKAYLGIQVDDLTFMGSANTQGSSQQSQGQQDGYQSPGGYGAGGSAMDDEIPFKPVTLI